MALACAQNMHTQWICPSNQIDAVLKKMSFRQHEIKASLEMAPTWPKYGPPMAQKIIHSMDLTCSYDGVN